MRVKRMNDDASIRETRREAIQSALLDINLSLGDADVFICHGDRKCFNIQEQVGFSSCKWCLVIAVGDLRTIDQIMIDLDKQANGH